MSRWRRKWHRRQRRHWLCVGRDWMGDRIVFDARTVGARTLEWVRDWRIRHG